MPPMWESSAVHAASSVEAFSLTRCAAQNSSGLLNNSWSILAGGMSPAFHWLTAPWVTPKNSADLLRPPRFSMMNLDRVLMGTDIS